MGHADGVHHFSLGDFLHFTFHHHNAVEASGDHHVEVGRFELFAGRIDNQFAVHPCNTDLGDRAVERYIRNSDGRRGRQSGQAV